MFADVSKLSLTTMAQVLKLSDFMFLPASHRPEVLIMAEAINQRLLNLCKRCHEYINDICVGDQPKEGSLVLLPELKQIIKEANDGKGEVQSR